MSEKTEKTEKTKILVISSEHGLQRHLVRLFDASAIAVESTSWDRQRIQDRHLADHIICIIDGDDSESEIRWLVAELTGRYTDLDLVVLATRHATPIIQDLVSHHNLRNLVGKHTRVPERGMIDGIEIKATCRKLMSPDIFGIEKYISSDTYIHEYDVFNTDDKKQVLSILKTQLGDRSLDETIQDAVLLAADELMMNAIFNAPRDTRGQPKYVNVDRNTAIQLERQERVTVRHASDGKRIAISVGDLFGSLNRETIIKYLHRSFAGKPVAMEKKVAGAGIGLYLVFNSVTQLVFNIQPGASCEVIAVFYVSGGPLGFKLSGRSLNIFILP